MPGVVSVIASNRNPPMSPLFSVPLAVTVKETWRAWKAESPVTAPGVLVTAAPAGWASVSGVLSVRVVADTDTMWSVSAGDPMVTVSPAANVSGLKVVPGCSETAVAPAAAAAASVPDPGVCR